MVEPSALMSVLVRVVRSDRPARCSSVSLLSPFAEVVVVTADSKEPSDFVLRISRLTEPFALYVITSVESCVNTPAPVGSHFVVTERPLALVVVTRRLASTPPAWVLIVLDLLPSPLRFVSSVEEKSVDPSAPRSKVF
ncbi:hypothetical protein D3C87_1514250 [compost metagenome]